MTSEVYTSLKCTEDSSISYVFYIKLIKIDVEDLRLLPFEITLRSLTAKIWNKLDFTEQFTEGYVIGARLRAIVSMIYFDVFWRRNGKRKCRVSLKMFLYLFRHLSDINAQPVAPNSFELFKDLYLHSSFISRNLFSSLNCGKETDVEHTFY